jgi:hypothetical protein
MRTMAHRRGMLWRIHPLTRMGRRREIGAVSHPAFALPVSRITWRRTSTIAIPALRLWGLAARLRWVQTRRSLAIHDLAGPDMLPWRRIIGESMLGW